jgi:hypothetical protein
MWWKLPISKMYIYLLLINLYELHTQQRFCLYPPGTETATVPHMNSHFVIILT